MIELEIDYHKNDFVQREPEYENYVFVNSQKYRELYAKGNNTSNECDREKLQGLVKIMLVGDCKHSIYRKCRGSAVPSDTILMGYRSAHALSDSPTEKVIVEPTNAICYLWHHNDAAVRIPFQIAVSFGLFSIILTIVGIVLTIVLSCSCC